MPYDTAQSLFGDLTGMHFGSERIHTVTNQAGAGLTVVDAAPSRQAIERRIAEVAVGRLRRPVLVLGIDRAYRPVPTGLGSPARGAGASGLSERGGGGSGATRRAFASP